MWPRVLTSASVVRADDHTLIGRVDADPRSTERDVYAFYSLKGTFGYNLSGPKTMWEVSQRFRSLGLECDTVQQTWRVPEDKKLEYRAIADVLDAQLAEGSPDPWALSRFAGKTVYYRRACDSLRYHQNLQFSVLSGRKLKREEVAADHRWWLHAKKDLRPLSKKLRKLLRVEIATCVALIAADRTHPFVSDEHILLVSTAGEVSMYTDTTLHTYGAVIREHGPGSRPDKVFGGVMPEEIMGVYIAKCNTGVVEIGGLVYACRIVDHDPEQLARMVNRMMDVYVDNFEDVRMLQTGKVRGEYTVEKMQLLLEFRHYMWKWNVRARVHYVNTLVNPADEPSRRKHAGEMRLQQPVFDCLWAVSGGFDVDAMASAANRQSVPGGDALPFISLGPDPEGRSVNFFAARHGRNPEGRRERLYVNPPFAMQRATVQWLKRCGSVGVLLIKQHPPPWPSWRVELGRYTRRSWIVRSPHSESRRAEGYVRMEGGPDLLACEFDFETTPLSRPAEAEELPATRG